MLEKYLTKTEFNSYEDLIENYKLNIPENFNFAYDIVDEWAKKDRNKTALIWCDDFGNEKNFTFNDLMTLSNKAANYLLSRGIKKGDKVLLILKQRPEVWVSLLALNKIGAVSIPCSYQQTEKDITYRITASNAKMIIIADDAEIVKHLKIIEKSYPDILILSEGKDNGFKNFSKEIEKFPDTLKRIENKTSDPMLIYFSSGTTGMPKMVLHDNSYPLGHITTAKYWQCAENNTKHLTMSDSGWAKFGWGKIYGQWICGAIIVAYDTEKFAPHRLLEKIDKLKLTTFCAPPTVFRFLVQEDLCKYDFSTIKHCCIAGEPLNPEIFNKFKEYTGLDIYEGFGQSETSVMIANYPYFKIKPGSIGKASPLYNIDIVDENGKHCEDGIVGSVVVKNIDKFRPAGLFLNYINDDNANKQSFKNNMYNTGDTAWRDSEGYFWFVGRNDDVIKCSGYRIGPFEVESVLAEHDAVLECAVTAAPDPKRGQIVKATVVLNKGWAASDELVIELQEHVKKLTAPYKYPRIVEFVPELPKTIGGKIKRAEIRKEVASG
ncbi:MAG: AMP-binding protein [Firmicutes bacterium]|nr:AMP-binding protein [Bacillota bacterium]